MLKRLSSAEDPLPPTLPACLSCRTTCTACMQFDSAIQRRLLQYAHSALLFADHGVDANLVSWNR